MKVSGTIKAMRKDRKGFQLDDGNWYSSFRALPESVGSGLNVEFDCVTKNQWKNIQGSVSVLGAAPVEANPVANTTGTGGGSAPQDLPAHYDKLNYATLVKTFPIPFDHPDRAIVRQNSLTNAVNLITHTGADLSKVKLSHLVEHALEVAQQFEAYSTGDIERVALEKLGEAPDEQVS